MSALLFTLIFSDKDMKQAFKTKKGALSAMALMTLQTQKNKRGMSLMSTSKMILINHVHDLRTVASI